MLQEWFENLFDENSKSLIHTYYLTATTNLGGDGTETPYRIKNNIFTRRKDAEKEMYRIADKLGLGRLSKIEDDGHYKTYRSETNKWITFQINRDETNI